MRRAQSRPTTRTGPHPGRGRALREGARRVSPRRRAWRALSILLTFWAVLVPTGMSGAAGGTAGSDSKAVTATMLREITHIPASAYNAVGTGTAAGGSAPRVEGTGSAGSALTFTGKPGLLYVGGDFCPFCAAERWAIIASLSRFGTFDHLKTMSSSATDLYPSTPTFTFTGATYSSRYLTAKLVELYGQTGPTVPKPPTIGTLTSKEQSTLADEDKTGSIPFVDFGNAVVQLGASYSPQILHGFTRAAIADALRHPTADTTQAILGTSNYFSAAVCHIDGAKPTTVCASPGVKAAAKALGFSG